MAVKKANSERGHGVTQGGKETQGEKDRQRGFQARQERGKKRKKIKSQQRNDHEGGAGRRKLRERGSTCY